MFQYVYLELCLNGEKKRKKQVKKCVAPLEPSDANERADKNEHFSVRSTTQTERIIKCVALVEMP
jgi:hypothetical protein